MVRSKFSEREELLWRILVGIVTGIILGVWKFLIIAIAILHFVKVLITDKRDRQLSDFCGYWNSEVYRYVRYMTFESDDRPFPFNDLKVFKRFEK